MESLPCENEFYLQDNKEIAASVYGGDIVLTNGILIKHEKQDGTLIHDFTDGIPIMINSDYAKFGFQVSDLILKDGKFFAHGVLTFTKNGGAIKLQPDEQLAIYFNDDFSGLISHTFRAGAYSLE